jgi:hypothetical protein
MVQAILKSRSQKSNPAYNSWRAMKARCYQPANNRYSQYGGRGIRVCDRWRGIDGFKNFLSDMGPRPSRRHSIDRINPNGHYEPSNCRWATPEQQQANKRSYEAVLPIAQEIKPASEQIRDVAGQRFGRLVAIEPAGMSGPHIVWSCQCDCGQITTTRLTSLRTGNTKSCGCLVRRKGLT